MKLLRLLSISLVFISMNMSAQWEELGDFPFAGRHHGIGFSLGGFGYMLTGNGNDYTRDVFKYDPTSDTWEDMGDYPGPARGFSIGDVWNEKGYFGFGYTGSGHADDLWEFDPVTGDFTELASFPGENRAHPAFVTLNGKIYMGMGSGLVSNLGDWWEYDIATDAWSQLADFIGNNRHHPFQFTLNGYIYVGSGHQSDWFRYDPANDSWIEVASHPSYTRVAGAQFNYNGKGYTLSGVGHLNGETHNPFPTGEFWEYDPLLDTWTELEPHSGISRWAPASFIIDGYVYMVSGDDASERSMDRYFLGEPATGLEELEEVSLSLFPLPFVDALTIDTDRDLNGALFSVYDAMGRKVFDQKLSGKSVDLRALEPGVYHIQIIAKEWEAQSTIVKEG